MNATYYHPIFQITVCVICVAAAPMLLVAGDEYGTMCDTERRIMLEGRTPPGWNNLGE